MKIIVNSAADRRDAARPELSEGTASSRRQDLLDEISQVEADLKRTETRLASLRAQLEGLDSPERAIPAGLNPRSSAPLTPAEKVALFRSLFRGRTDVYPTRFVSKSTGKAGYAPACSAKFVPGVCELPRVKCGDCSAPAFKPLDDSAVVAHLKGQHVMGIYPLLPDETCWLLAIDLDESTWAEDARALAKTAGRLGLPAAVERSRSGNGAHIWFFFSAPVPAVLARRMGCHLITETMASRSELSMDSYDRLFPSQDTMPRGGFGNLIALPLQHGPRQEGNSVFVDRNLLAFPGDEQWAYLASIERIDPATVERIATAAARSGSVVGLRGADEVEDEAELPWTRLPSGRPRAPRIEGPFPPRVKAVFGQMLFIEKVGLPSPLLNQLKRLAAFQNPEFFKKQSMRLSTASTPRVISCAQDLSHHVALPRGCRSTAEALLGSHGIAMETEDERVNGDHLELRFQGDLTAAQLLSARAILENDTGVLVAPPGSGKTVIGAYLVAERGVPALILVHRRPLLDQWRSQLAAFLGVEAIEIGQLGAGKRKPTGRIDVAMIQSLVRKDSVADLVAGYGHVIVDECHHVPAVSFERVLSAVKARYVVGLTATPQRRDGHHPIAEMQLGPVRFSMNAKTQAVHRPFQHRLIVRETGFRPPEPISGLGIQALYAALSRDEARNQMILGDVIDSLKEGRSPILLTERRDHLDYFAGKLTPSTPNVIVLHGGMGIRARREALDRLRETPASETRVLLATGRYIGEGFDDTRLDTLFLALPVSWKGTLVQYTGRLHRLHPGKSEVRIFDYVDRDVTVLTRMFERRLRGYRAIGYGQAAGFLGLSELAEHRVADPAGSE